MYSLRSLYFKSAAALTVLALSNSAAMAQGNLETVSANLTKNLNAVETVLGVICYIGGIAFGIAGVLKLKEYMDKPGQEKLSTPLGRLLVGALLIALPTLLSIITTSSTGSDGSISVSNVRIGQ